jgi:hypothetical protein
MPLFTRLVYALYLAIALSMIVSLGVVLASADAIAILPSSSFDFALSPGLFFLAYVISFAVAPFVAKRFPIKQDR